LVIKMKYTDRIRSLREDKDLTQTDVAKLLNIGQKTYSDYELGKTRIPLDSALILAKYYNVSMDYLSGASDIKTAYPSKP
jgi:transcriptional regulator with XRE-family HTH domain